MILSTLLALATPCPSYPPLAPWEYLLADRGVIAALETVERDLFSTAAAKLPSGFVASIVYNQTTIASIGYGKRKPEPDAPPPSGNDLVRIASITKTFTDLLGYKLRDAGTVSLDEPVTKYFPGFEMLHLGRTRGRITLRNLMSHLSGLPRELPYPCSFDGKQCTEAEVLQLLKEQVPVLAPYRRFHYSNLGIAVAGRALAHAAGKATTSYEALLGTEVLAPLGMVNATFDTSEALSADRIAVGVHPDGKPLNLSATCTPAEGAPGSWLAPCGCLWASADDLALLMKLFFRDDLPADDKSQIVDGDTIHELLSPQVLMRDGYEAIGSPWEMVYLPKSKIWAKGKQGELPGYRSSVQLIEPLKLGVFTSALVSDVDSPTVWTQDALEILTPAIMSALWKLQKPGSIGPSTELLVGRYYDGSVSVKLEGKSTLYLRLSPTAKPLSLTYVESVSTKQTHVYRASPVNSTSSCRSLDDGQDLEYAYFTLQEGNAAHADHLRFMSGLYAFYGP